MIKRTNETTKLIVGQKVAYGEFKGTVVRLYSDDGATEACRMYEVRLPGGVGCYCGADLIPVDSSPYRITDLAGAEVGILVTLTGEIIPAKDRADAAATIAMLEDANRRTLAIVHDMLFGPKARTLQ